MQAMEVDDRFEIIQKIGEGSFSKIYKARDNLRGKFVALKVEKEGRIINGLRSEFETMQQLQGLQHVPTLYDFIESYRSDLFSMELLAINILIQMLDAIEDLHDRGFIHRDIKPNNFVMGIDSQENSVYIIDFGLAKLHLDNSGHPFPELRTSAFHGTVTYASLNAHYHKDLGRSDDLWSFFFIILELLENLLPWRDSDDEKDQIKNSKETCLQNPEIYLLPSSSRAKTEILEILAYLKTLSYSSKPDYQYFRSRLWLIKEKEEKENDTKNQTLRRRLLETAGRNFSNLSNAHRESFTLRNKYTATRSSLAFPKFQEGRVLEKKHTRNDRQEQHISDFFIPPREPAKYLNNSSSWGHLNFKDKCKHYSNKVAQQHVRELQLVNSLNREEKLSRFEKQASNHADSESGKTNQEKELNEVLNYKIIKEAARLFSTQEGRDNPSDNLHMSFRGKNEQSEKILPKDTLEGQVGNALDNIIKEEENKFITRQNRGNPKPIRDVFNITR